MDEQQWKKGFPNKKGWYRCRIDGEEMQLYLFVCELNPKKKYWNDQNGNRLDEDVEWR